MSSVPALSAAAGGPPRERPILFSAPMVRAILAGRKTVTRRIVKPQPEPNDYGTFHWPSNLCRSMVETRDMGSLGPYGGRLDRLWVRETWCQKADLVHGELIPGEVHYRADGYEVRHVDGPDKSPWKPSIYMPRWASRITLEVVDVRVERLHEMTEAEALLEGVEPTAPSTYPSNGCSALQNFRHLWASINGGSWSVNPWVWRIEFRRIGGPNA